jgi:hypothetical protein
MLCSAQFLLSTLQHNETKGKSVDLALKFSSLSDI